MLIDTDNGVVRVRDYLLPGQVTVLAGRPHTGKTGLACDLVSITNRRIMMSYISLREPYEIIYKRIQERNRTYIDLFDSFETFFEQSSYYTLPDPLVVVDDINYGQEYDFPRLFEDLKIYAEEHMSPILVLSQLPRKIDARKNKRPLLRDIPMKECLDLIDNVIFLYRENYYTGEEGGEAEAIVAKCKLGKEVIPLKWNAEKASFL